MTIKEWENSTTVKNAKIKIEKEIKKIIEQIKKESENDYQKAFEKLSQAFLDFSL